MTSQNPSFNIPPTYTGINLCYQRNAAGQRDGMLNHFRQEASKFGIDTSNMDIFQIQAELEKLANEVDKTTTDTTETSHQTGTKGESSSKGK